MNEEDVQHASSSNNKYESGAERSSQRPPKDVGAQEDVEELHGKAHKVGEGKESNSASSKGRDDKTATGSDGNSTQEKQGYGEQKGGKQTEGHEVYSEMRHKAERFVNLED
jgi:hypothetical protein